MYISINPPNFTDDELENIFHCVNNRYTELTKSLGEADPNNSMEEYLSSLYSILNKIERSGLFN